MRIRLLVSFSMALGFVFGAGAAHGSTVDAAIAAGPPRRVAPVRDAGKAPVAKKTPATGGVEGAPRKAPVVARKGGKPAAKPAGKVGPPVRRGTAARVKGAGPRPTGVGVKRPGVGKPGVAGRTPGAATPGGRAARKARPVPVRDEKAPLRPAPRPAPKPQPGVR